MNNYEDRKMINKFNISKQEKEKREEKRFQGLNFNSKYIILKKEHDPIMGLKEIAKEVNIFMLEENTENYKTICEKMVMNHNFEEKDEKNIKRRIYDALNVIKSIKYFDKDLDANTLKLSKEKELLDCKIVRLF